MSVESKKILIVDDEKDIRDICGNVINRHFDFEVFKVGNVKQAMDIIAKESPEFAILDLNLPDGNGFELVNPLKMSNKNAAFIIVTAHNQCSEKEKANELGAMTLLGKPFSTADLKRAVQILVSEPNYEKK